MRASWSSIYAPTDRRWGSARHQHPVIEIKQDGWIVIVANLERKVGARLVTGGDGPKPHCANIVTALQVGFGEHFRPSENRAARKQRRHVAAAINGSDMEGVGEAVERQSAGERYHVAAIDQ